MLAVDLCRTASQAQNESLPSLATRVPAPSGLFQGGEDVGVSSIAVLTVESVAGKGSTVYPPYQGMTAELRASRAGLVIGEDIVEIQGKKVEQMEQGEAQSLVNANAQAGVELLVRGKDGAERRVTIKEGIVYPSVEDGVPLG